MGKTYVLFSALLLVISYASAAPEFQANLTGIPIAEFDSATYIPPDDGYSNWGDLIYQKRQNGDRLIVRDILTYPVGRTEFYVKFTIPITNVVTSVTMINFGRQRGYGTDIKVYPNYLEAYYYVPALADPRIMIDVYGF